MLNRDMTAWLLCRASDPRFRGLFGFRWSLWVCHLRYSPTENFGIS